MKSVSDSILKKINLSFRNEQKINRIYALFSLIHFQIRKKINQKKKWFGFGLVSLFNGISTFVGYLMPNLFS